MFKSKKFFRKPAALTAMAAIAVMLTATLLIVCTEPKYCGDKVLTDKEFCFGGTAFDKCGGKEYDPGNEFCPDNKNVKKKCGGGKYNLETHFCDTDSLYKKCGGKTYDPRNQKCEDDKNVLTQCGIIGNKYFNPIGQFCDNDSVYNKCAGTVTYNPRTTVCDKGVLRVTCDGTPFDTAKEFCYNLNLYPLCNGKDYIPTERQCDKEKGILLKRCGNTNSYYDSTTQFCFNNTSVHDKCVDKDYNPLERQCDKEKGILLLKCGNTNNYYDSTSRFCANDTVYAKCGGKYIYAPPAQKCENNIVLKKCGSDYYDSTDRFCVANVIYPKCNGNDYKPDGYKCDNNILKTKCGENGYYNPATEFCLNGAVLATCGGKDYDPSKQKCNGTTLVDKVIVTVAFNANGAKGGTPISMSQEDGDTITLPLKGTLSKDGYRFAGWNTNDAGTGTNYNANAKFEVAGNAGATVTLYARWIRIFNVTFNGNGATANVPVAVNDVDSGDVIKLSAMTRQYYEFNGWSASSTGTENYPAGFDYVVKSNVTLYAKWTVRKCVITFYGNGTAVGVPEARTVDAGKAVTLPSMTRTNFRFMGWNTKIYGDGTDYFPTKSDYIFEWDIDLYAMWTLPTITDARDAKTYKITEIGGKWWMAENLNYETTGSWCYKNSADSCTKYGRLYTWAAAKTSCPAGWKLPDTADWGRLTMATNGRDKAGKALKSRTGWSNNGNGTDDFGFSALPGGQRSDYSVNENLGYSLIGTWGNWWTGTENGIDMAYYMVMKYDYDGLGYNQGNKTYAYSVRCIEDD